MLGLCPKQSRKRVDVLLSGSGHTGVGCQSSTSQSPAQPSPTVNQNHMCPNSSRELLGQGHSPSISTITLITFLHKQLQKQLFTLTKCKRLQLSLTQLPTQRAILYNLKSKTAYGAQAENKIVKGVCSFDRVSFSYLIIYHY